MTQKNFAAYAVAVFSAVISFFGVNNINAQSLTQQQLDSLNVLNLKAIQASIADHANKDYAWETENLPTSNKLEITNRRGFLIGAEGGFNFNHGYEAGLKVGYQGAGLRCFAPEAFVYAGQVEVDGLSYTSYGVEARGNFEFGSETFKIFAGPTVGYKYFTVDTGVMFDGEVRNHNQHSNALKSGCRYIVTLNRDGQVGLWDLAANTNETLTADTLANAFLNKTITAMA